MKILHLISSSGLLGPERVLLELAEHSKRSGLKVTIGVFNNSQNPNFDLAKYAKGKDFDIQIFPCNGRFDKKTIRMINDHMDQAGIQILHSHNYKSNFYARRTLSNNNIRWIVTNHGRRFGPKLMLYIPTLRMLLQKPEEIRVRANTIARRLKKEIQNAHIKVMADSSRAGGGSLPERDLPTFVTAVKPDSVSVNELEEILRKGTPPVITRIKEDTLVLDARTIRNNDIATLVQRIKSALS